MTVIQAPETRVPLLAISLPRGFGCDFGVNCLGRRLSSHFCAARRCCAHGSSSAVRLHHLKAICMRLACGVAPRGSSICNNLAHTMHGTSEVLLLSGRGPPKNVSVSACCLPSVGNAGSGGVRRRRRVRHSKLIAEQIGHGVARLACKSFSGCLSWCWHVAHGQSRSLSFPVISPAFFC